jgi:alpha-amylase/alpha-mannosidase (GH57 family)
MPKSASPKNAARAAKPPLAPVDGSLRYVCVHGHFYQPPRENPWLETVEVQDSAAPYHDWNDRITAECYAPNGASRITNAQGQIIRIMNNYARMSYNFGPTLLSWLADKAPRAYRMILDADRFSAQRYSGHGSAMAQVYNHVILPLASERDALTQIRWGIADFEHRFGRRPEGMWLSETAVNRFVLDLLAREGIRFTILAPNQCARVRRMDQTPSPASSSLAAVAAATAVSATALPASSLEPSPNGSLGALPDLLPQWIGTPNATVDPTHPYLIQLDQGRSISVFFYNGPDSRAIAFEGLLNSGEDFARRLLAGFHPAAADEPEKAQLSHVATDGESYGHHHRHGEMALSYAMHWIEEEGHARLTNYGEFLAKFPPAWEAELVEDTSWSCAHGVERWRSNCGCNGGKSGWNQEWRKPLRDALDFLRDATAPLAEELAAGLLTDLWAARDAYIQVILSRETAFAPPPGSPSAVDRFLAKYAVRPLTSAERVTVLELLELERHTQLMYTSCGWFFDDISGIETVQIIAYAGRVLQLAQELFADPVRFGTVGLELEPKFLAILANAKSNVPEIGDGAEVYRRYVTGMKIGLEQVGAHFAISSIFRNYPEDSQLFCFDLHRDSHEVFASGRGKVALGRARVRSRINEEAEEICFAVLHLGDQNLSAAVRCYTPSDEDAFAIFSADIRTAIRRANLPEVIRLIDRFFGETVYSLTSLFADEQHSILRTILNQTMSEMEDSLRTIYEDHASLLHYLTESGMSPPPALALAASFAINASLRRALEADAFDVPVIQGLLNRAETDQVQLDIPLLSFAAGQRMKRAMVRLEAVAAETVFKTSGAAATAALNTALTIAETLDAMPFEVNLWQSQNIWNDLLRRFDSSSWPPDWKEGFKKLGVALNIAVDRLVVEEGVTIF